jgi:hypothetical protein
MMAEPALQKPLISRQSLVIYLALVGYLVAVKICLIALPNLFRSPAQAAVFQWPFLALWAGLGFIGVVLSERTGFPSAWAPSISKTKLLLLPAVLGVALGILAIYIDRVTGWTSIVAAKMHLPSIHIEFPASLLIYPGGAIIVEIIYRLFLIPLLLWILSGLILKGRSQSAIFWTLAVLTSLIEPLGDFGLRQYGMFMMSAVFLEDYALNFAQAVFFRKYGFFCAILLRVWFYLLWHVLYGALTS